MASILDHIEVPEREVQRQAVDDSSPLHMSAINALGCTVMNSAGYAHDLAREILNHMGVPEGRLGLHCYTDGPGS